MEQLKRYLYITLIVMFLIVLLFKWIKYNNFKSTKDYFFNSFYYNNYEIVNSRNRDSKKNKIFQNYLSLILVIVICLEIILLLLFSVL